MLQWQKLLPWVVAEEPLESKGLDLGNGVVLKAEDVVDSHAKRLQTRNGSASLSPALRSLAPDLAPLTDLAQSVADQSPDARPADKFRSDLQRALETSHKQQTVRRTLGIQPAAKVDPPVWQSPWFVALLLGVVMTWMFFYRRQRNAS